MRRMSNRSTVYLCSDHHHWVYIGQQERDCPECRKVKA